jgi:DNA-binding transcriptional LysR family regulator
VPSLKGRFSRSVTRPSGWIDKRSHAGSRLTATAFADELALHVKLAFSLIRHGLEELASLEGTLRGSLVIGTLPYSRTLLTPRTIHRVLEAHPALRISTREGPYQMLETALRNGEVDLIVGATRELDACGGVALLSRHQVHHDEKAGLLAALPVQLEGTWRPIGITRRAHTTPSPAATVFMAELRRMAKALALPGVRS